jgi:3-oxoacyl-[acyl-carrier protein] reductase
LLIPKVSHFLHLVILQIPCVFPTHCHLSPRDLPDISVAGEFQIDILVNNAGVGVNSALGDIKVSDFDRVYKVNVLGPLLLMQAAFPYLPHDRSGRVINVSSVSATLGFAAQSIYGGTKAALEAMTRSWSRELAERATVNSINPGPVKTDMWDRVANNEAFIDMAGAWTKVTPLMKAREGIDDPDLVEGAKSFNGRPAYPSEIGGIVGMLCTPDAAWCTGQSVCANGGMRMSI